MTVELVVFSTTVGLVVPYMTVGRSVTMEPVGFFSMTVELVVLSTTVVVLCMTVE